MGLSNLIAQFTKQQQQAQQATQQRLDDILSQYDEIISKYQPGGEYMKGAEASLDREREKAMASGMQSLVGRGLSGTTMHASQGMQFSEDIAAPALARMEDQRMDALTQAMIGQAGVLERVEDVGPDPGLIAQLTMAASSAPQYTGQSSAGGQTYGASSFSRPAQPKTPTNRNDTSGFTWSTPTNTGSYQAPDIQMQAPIMGDLRQSALPALTTQQQSQFQSGAGPVSASYAAAQPATGFQQLANQWASGQSYAPSTSTVWF